MDADDYEHSKSLNDKDIREIEEFIIEGKLDDEAHSKKLWDDLVHGHEEKELTVTCPSP